MPKLLNRDPAYRLHKSSGQARVRIGGRELFLGPHGSAESWREYDRIVGLWRANGRRLPVDLAGDARRGDGQAIPPVPAGVTVNEIVLAYWRHAEAYYVKDGEPTMEVESVHRALKFARDLFGEVEGIRFGPKAIEAIQQAMIRHGWCRTHINRQVNRVKRMIAWAVSQEMIPPSVHQAIQTVSGLKKGRTAAREKPPVDAVPDDAIDRTLAHLSPTVAAMVRLQRLTGMRPQEVCGIRGDEIDRSDPSCWAYRPGRHKGEHHDRDRVIFIGPKGQEVLGPFLALGGGGFLFSPARAEAERGVAKRAARRTPLYPSHQKRRRASRPKAKPGDRYTRHSYRVAIQRACDRAGVARWHPHQVRHTSATAIREAFGIEHSKAVLGHSEISSTLIYAAQDLARAREVARTVG